MGRTKDTHLVKEYNSDVKLLGAEVMRHRRESTKTRQGNIEGLRPEYSMGELRRFAQVTIDERIKFCRDYKKDEPLGRCVCEAVDRYIRLSKESSIKGDKHLRELRLEAIQKLFEEMKKEGKIKCPDNNSDNNNDNKYDKDNNDQNNQTKQPV